MVAQDQHDPFFLNKFLFVASVFIVLMVLAHGAVEWSGWKGARKAAMSEQGLKSRQAQSSHGKGSITDAAIPSRQPCYRLYRLIARSDSDPARHKER